MGPNKFRMLKNAQVQGAPAFAEAAARRQAKSFVGNGLKPFPTDVRRNKPAPCLTRGRMRGCRCDE